MVNSKKANILEAAKRSIVSNSHGLRVEAQAHGIGLMASGSYVAAQVRGEGIKLALGVDKKALVFGERGVAKVNGNKGSLCRAARLSNCKGFVLFSDDTLLSVETLDVEFFSEIEFWAMAQERGLAWKVESTKTHKEFSGFLIGSQWGTGATSQQYATLAYLVNGALAVRDIETKKVLGRNTGENQDVLHSFKGEVAKAAVAGELTVEQVAKVAKSKAARVKVASKAKGKGKA